MNKAVCHPVEHLVSWCQRHM